MWCFRPSGISIWRWRCFALCCQTVCATSVERACVVSEALTEYAHPRLSAWAYRRFYARFDVVVCQSLDMRDDLVGHFTFPAAKAVIIHNPVDVERVRCLAAEVSSRDHEPRRAVPKPRRTWSPLGACRTRKASIY